MLNQIILVGRLAETVEDNKIKIIVPKNYKNENGEYDNDIIPILLSEKIYKNTKEYCSKGDILGVKGKITSSEDGNLYVEAEKISFLSSKKEEE